MGTTTLPTIQGYIVHEEIEAGGFGVVYRATQPLLGRDVAIKFILPRFANEPEFVRNFEAEAQRIARLEHPHIVPVYDYWRDPQGAYLVMRWLPCTLKTRLQQGPLTLPETLHLLDQLADALATTHRQGVIHRDVKPGNILLDDQHNYYLTDFGIAKDLLSRVMTGSHIMKGTVAYIAPEQARGEVVSPQTDIYSLGVMLYEVLTGQHPFEGLSSAEMIVKHLNEPLPELPPHLNLPIELNAVLHQATAKQPIERYPTTLAFAQAFRAAVPSVAEPPSSRLHRAIVDEPPTTLGHLVIRNPYKGLHAFELLDAGDFYGREALVHQLLTRLHDDHPLQHFLAVVGASGSGKSSVVKAGLLPALRAGCLPGSQDWFTVEMSPAEHPLQELTHALNRVATKPISHIAEQLRADRRGLIWAVASLLSEEARLVLVVDQFEELFTTSVDEEEVAQFLEVLRVAVNDVTSGVRVIITLRADFMDRLLQYLDFGDLLKQRIEYVLPLSPTELAEAITCPAEQVGLQVEPGLVTAIVADVQDEPGALPLLQYTLTELFDQRDNHALTLAAYERLGGLSGALAQRADQIFEQFPSSQQALIRQLFMRLVTLGEGVEDTRRRVRQSELLALVDDPDALLDVLGHFGQARLLTFDRDLLTREPTVEVAHEALIREWRRLRTWLDDSRYDIRQQRLLATAAQEWEEAKRDRSYLLTGSRLAQFEGWVGQTNVALTPNEQTYLDISLMEEQRQQSRRRRVRNVILVAAALVAGVMTVLALLALNERDKAESARDNERIARGQAEDSLRRTDAQRLGLESLSLVQTGGESDLIALLAIQSITTDYTPQGDLAVQSAMLQQYPRQVFTSSYGAGRPYNLVLSPDGVVLAVIVGGVMDVWNVATGELILSSEEFDMVFLPDGRLATLRLDGTVYVWDIQTREATLLGTFSGTMDLRYNHIDMLPSKGQLVIVGGTGWVVLLDAETGNEITRFLPYPNGKWQDMAVSPDGTRLLLMGLDSYARLWDIETQQEIRSYYHDGEFGWAVTFAPDGHTIATATAAPQIRIWDIDSPDAPLLTFNPHSGYVQTMVFSSDSNVLISSGGDTLIHFWDVVTGTEVRTPLVHPAATRAFRFSPDEQLIYTTGEDGLIRVWDVEPRFAFPEFRSFSHHHSEAFSPDGTLLAKLYLRRFSLYDTATWAEVAYYETTEEQLLDNIIFSHDGRYVAFGSRSGTIHLWDIKAGDIVQTYTGLTDISLDVDISADNRYIAAGDFNGNLVVWDLASGATVFSQAIGKMVYSVNFSPDVRFLLTTGWVDGKVQLWETTTWEEEWNLPMVSHESDAAFSPDGRYFVVGGGGLMLSLWDTETRTKVRDFTGHYKDIMAVNFSADGKYILSGSQDGTARLWDVATGIELRRFGVSGGAVRHVLFAPNGDYVLVDDGSLSRFWFTSLQDSIDYLCARITRDLTDVERSLYEIKDDTPTCPESIE